MQVLPVPRFLPEFSATPPYLLLAITPPPPDQMVARNEKALGEALAAWRAGKFKSYEKCAAFYGVNRKTLQNRDKGKHSFNEGNAKQQLLTKVQEDGLVKWILTLEAFGCATIPTKDEGRAEPDTAESKKSGGLQTTWAGRRAKPGEAACQRGERKRGKEEERS